MYDKEKESREALKILKRWAKKPTSESYTRGYTAGNADREPAMEIYQFICELSSQRNINPEGKLDLIESYVEKGKNEYLKKPNTMGDGYYGQFHRWVLSFKKDLEYEIPIQALKRRK